MTIIALGILSVILSNYLWYLNGSKILTVDWKESAYNARPQKHTDHHLHKATCCQSTGECGKTLTMHGVGLVRPYQQDEGGGRPIPEGCPHIYKAQPCKVSLVYMNHPWQQHLN